VHGGALRTKIRLKRLTLTRVIEALGSGEICFIHLHIEKYCSLIHTYLFYYYFFIILLSPSQFSYSRKKSRYLAL